MKEKGGPRVKSKELKIFGEVYDKQGQKFEFRGRHGTGLLGGEAVRVIDSTSIRIRLVDSPFSEARRGLVGRVTLHLTHTQGQGLCTPP